MSEYREHNPRELGEYYTTHIMAMTAEKLYGKSAIAAELAYRDKRISELEAESQRLNDLLLRFGDAVTDMFEQMTKGNWIDDHWHDVRMNIKMVALIPLVEELMAMRQASIEVRKALEKEREDRLMRELSRS